MSLICSKDSFLVMTKGSCLYVFTVSMATFRMAVEAGMVVKEEAEDGDSSKTEWWTQGDGLQ